MTAHDMDAMVDLQLLAGEPGRVVAALLPEGVLDTLIVALGVSHRDALAYLTDPDTCLQAYWVGQLWAVERAQRALGLEWDS